MIKDIYIFDDIIDSKAQKHIQDIFFNRVKYNFLPDVTSPDNKQQRPAFKHSINVKTDDLSDWHFDMCKVIDAACNKINFKRKDILQGRSFLQLPLNLKDKRIDAPHVDSDVDHMVVLYYVNDSDGDTVIYENKFEGYDKVPTFDKLKEKKRITPKSGRVLLFNGKHWHTSCQPEHNVRCVVNYNVV